MTGDAAYDRFFAQTSDLYSAVKEAEQEEQNVRAALARRIGLSEAAAIDVLGARLRERTAQWASEGLTLELEFTGIDGTDGADGLAPDDAALASGGAPIAVDPDTDGADSDAASGGGADLTPPPTATLRTPNREPERRELRLLEVLAQAALSGATVYADMGRVQHRSVVLADEGSKLLAQVDATFQQESQREIVRAKLLEATEFLPELGERARLVSNAADVLIAVLDEAANTSHAGPARRRAPRDGAPGEPVAPGPPVERAPRRAAPKEPAAPAASQRPADFEP